jgi:uncharacterized membrane protein YphA (DoxX/SURF4 family)
MSTSIESIMKTLRGRLLTATERLAFLAPFLIRLTVGLVFIRTGWGKLQNLGDITEYFASLHIPCPGSTHAWPRGPSSSAASSS